MKEKLLAGAVVVMCAAVLVGAGAPENAPPVWQTSPEVMRGAEVIPEVKHDTSPPLREMTVLHSPPGERVHEIHLLHPPRAVQFISDPVLQTSTLPAVPTSSGLNFDGVGANGSAPPDTNGAAGATQFVEWVNTEFAVYDKATGNLLFGPAAGNTLWQGFGGPCQTNNDGDAIAQYDKLNNRCVMSQLSVTGGPPFFQCVAVSTTSDATGTWNRYAFQQPNFNDYPKMGIWSDAYYESFNMFSGNFFVGARACAFDSASMRAGGAATQQCFQLSSTFGGLLPSDVDGTTPPPAGEPAFFVNFDSSTLSSLNLWRFHVDFSNAANSTFTGPTSLSVAPFSEACGGGTCVPQLGTSQRLDSLGDRLMYRLAYRNFLPGHESLVTNHSIVAGSSVGVRWYELRDPNGNPFVFQQGTFAPDLNFRWMGSIAMDKAGNIAVGFSVSSSGIHPAIRYTGRVPSDPLGMLESETSIIEGTGSQTRTLNRWGDYSSMALDPTDDCTLWYANEYLQTNGKFNWSTRIASFRFPSCALPAAPSGLSATAGNAQVSLSWNSSAGATSYNVLRSTTNGGPYTTIVTGLTTTSYRDNGLTNGTTYYYVVQAVNSAGTSPSSNQVSATPTCSTPTAPTGLSATAGNAQVLLGWTASSGAASYNVKRSTTNGGPYTTIATGIATTNYTDTGLTNGNAYYYVVSAVNSCGESGNSNQASATPSAAQSWSNGYLYRRTITIDHTKVPNTDQMNFPALISGTYSYLATTGNGGNVTNANGYDIIFTSDANGSNPLAFERESYNASTGAVNFWVKVPTVSHSSDTVIYMFYGNSSVTTDQSNKMAVWDSNHKGVWHLPDGTTLSAADSTSNSNTGTITSTTAATGQIDGGASFNGSTSRIDISGIVNSSLLPNYTVEVWLNRNATQPTGYGTFISRHPSGGGNQYFLVTSGGTVYRWDGFPATQTISANAWHHVVYTYDGTTERFYIDGAAAGSNVATLSWDPDNWRFGMNTGGYRQYSGLIDEVRISNAVRSADWISTEYNNQSSPLTFYSVGPANTAGGSSSPTINSLSPTSGAVGTSVTITGTNFGSTQGSSTATFNGTTATPTSWSATSIVAPVPAGATTGNVVVTVGGVASNGVNFTVTGSGLYTFHRAITIDHTKVPNTDQTNFPVLISGTYSYLATTGNGGNVTNANGYDIIFTSDANGSNPLAFERESYNASTGAVNFWVKVPTVSHSSDTVIYMFYGNSSVTTDQSNKMAVWDSNHKGVWHLPDGTTLSAADSTSNSNTGTITSTTAATGQIDGGASFNGSTSRIDISGIVNSSLLPNYTVEVWLNRNATQPTGYGTFISRHSSGGGNQYFLVTSGGTVYRWDGFPATQTISANAWHHVVYTYDGTTERFYIDGAAAGSNVATLSWDPDNWRFGMNTGGYRQYSGLIDEVRISNAVRSADWISTEYNNQSSPLTFYSVGPAQ